MKLIKFWLLCPIMKVFSILWDHGGFRNCTGEEKTDEEVFSKLNWYGKIGIKGFMWCANQCITQEDWDEMLAATKK